MHKLERNKVEGVEIGYQIVVEEATKCLDALIDLKKELLYDNHHDAVDDDDDELYPFGNVFYKNDAEKNKDFVNKMILCNLFALSMSDDKEFYESLKWKTKIDQILCKPKKKSMFYDDSYVDPEGASTASTTQKLNTLKWIFGGAMVVGTIAILIKKKKSIVTGLTAWYK